jgi:hypothetical protein
VVDLGPDYKLHEPVTDSFSLTAELEKSSTTTNHLEELSTSKHVTNIIFILRQVS